MKYALDALDEMLDEDIFVIPVRLVECHVPQKLKDLQWVDIFAQGGLKKLIKALRVGAERRLGPELSEKTDFPAEDASVPTPTPIDLSGLGGAGLLDSLSLKNLLGRRRN